MPWEIEHIVDIAVATASDYSSEEAFAGSTKHGVSDLRAKGHHSVPFTCIPSPRKTGRPQSVLVESQDVAVGNLGAGHRRLRSSAAARDEVADARRDSRDGRTI